MYSKANPCSSLIGLPKRTYFRGILDKPLTTSVRHGRTVIVSLANKWTGSTYHIKLIDKIIQTRHLFGWQNIKQPAISC